MESKQREGALDKGENERSQQKRKDGKPTREKGKKKSDRERERKERETKREIFPAYQWSELDGLRRKVDPRIASYALVPKSWSFVKLHEVRNFPTWNIFSIKPCNDIGYRWGRVI